MLTPYRFPVLISYAFARQHLDDFALYANHPNIDLMLDSGAFTAKNTGKEIKLADYCSFLDTWKDKLFSYIMLDVLNDPVQSDINLQVMLSSGYAPMGVHVFGDDQRRMDYLFDVCGYVALGGLKRASGGAANPSYVKAVMGWARGRKVHWLGYTNESMFPFRPFSIDSSTWKVGKRFGEIDYYIGHGKWSGRIKYHNRNRLLSQPGFRRTLDRLDCANSFHVPWKAGGDTGVLSMVPFDSFVRYTIDIFAHFSIKNFLVMSPLEYKLIPLIEK